MISFLLHDSPVHFTFPAGHSCQSQFCNLEPSTTVKEWRREGRVSHIVSARLSKDYWCMDNREIRIFSINITVQCVLCTYAAIMCFVFCRWIIQIPDATVPSSDDDGFLSSNLCWEQLPSFIFLLERVIFILVLNNLLLLLQEKIGVE